MSLKDIFEGIGSLFVDILMLPMDALRALELESWFLANILNWVFVIVGFIAFFFWMKQLKKYNDEGKEDTSSTSHSYLG